MTTPTPTPTGSTSAPSSAKMDFQMPPLPADTQATQKVGNRLVELVRQGKNLDAIRELYADEVKQIEMMDGPGCARITAGKQALLQKAEQFHKSVTVHSASCGDAIANGDQFVCPMSLDCTSNEGPMSGQRMNMTETALYTVKNGKITEAKFFYGMGC